MSQLLEIELVPLFEAASLAYLELTGVEGQVGSDEHLRDVVDLQGRGAITNLRNANGPLRQS